MTRSFNAPDTADAFSKPTHAKIVATIGPASDADDMIERLLRAGVSVFRVNFSHGTLEQHAVRVAAIRRVASRLGVVVGILGDLQGPKIRVGSMSQGLVFDVVPGDDILLIPSPAFTTREPGFDAKAPGDRTLTLPCAYQRIGVDVLPGHRVLINDGFVRLLAVDREPGDPAGSLRARVTAGGGISSAKGINLPDSDVKESAISERDWQCVEWAVATGLDFVALSFVRRAEEVLALRKALAGMCAIDPAVALGGEAATIPSSPGVTGKGAMIPVIAKIEKPEAVTNIDAILEAADGIMVARGDLGVEMDLAQVPHVQKRLIAKADEWGKPCIVATQMLETMITASSPTRAEASDVANAVLDGADAVMLSAETATGKHPALVVETMRRIIAEAEVALAERVQQPSPAARLMKSRYRTAALAHGAWHVARDLGAVAIACWSQSGGTARYLAQTGINIRVLAYSSDPRETRRMTLLRSVTPVLAPVPRAATGDGSLAAWNHVVERDLLARGWARPGEPIVLLAGKPLGDQGATNLVAIHYIGNPATGFMRHTM